MPRLFSRYSRKRSPLGKPRARWQLKKKRQQRKQLKNRTTVPVGLGFPKKIVMTHKYVDTGVLSSTAGVINKYQWSANSLFDPNTTGGGHQPMYFDQMAALYNHYTVIGAKFKVTCTPYASNSAGGFVGAYIDDDTTTTNITGISSLVEQSTSRRRVISPASNNTFTFNLKWSAKKTFGGSILANDNLQGSITTDPLEQSFFTLAVQGFGVAPDVSIQYLVEVQYIAVWDELKQVAQS